MHQYACSFVVETVHTCSLITNKKRSVAIECVMLKQEKKKRINKEETSVIQIYHSVIGDIVTGDKSEGSIPRQIMSGFLRGCCF